MLLKYFYDKTLAQASYMVGCAETGEALVVDPARDITPYLNMAAEEGLRITQVTETHIHADFASGSRELAAQTGATLYLSDMGDADWKYAYPADLNIIKVHEGDKWMVGNVCVEALHTPGHTPEHLSFIITDTAGADQPIGIFTGDFVFVGDVGRPDLLEEAAGLVGTRESGARQQFHSLQHLKQYPDYLQLWTGHGAGSACGKALGALPSTTLGYEKLFNPAFQIEDEDQFVNWLLEGQPEAPRYFAHMKKINKTAPSLLGDLTPPMQGNDALLKKVLAEGALVIDFRRQEDYAHAHLLRTVSIPSTSNNYSTYVGWFVDYTRPLYVIVPEAKDLDAILRDLRGIGIDDIPAFFTEDALTGQLETLPSITAGQLAIQKQMDETLLVVDVRAKSEYEHQHIQGSKHVMLGHLPKRLADLPKDRWLVTQCASGYRSQVAASWLRRQGFEKVLNLQADEKEWVTLLPTEKGS